VLAALAGLLRGLRILLTLLTRLLLTAALLLLVRLVLAALIGLALILLLVFVHRESPHVAPKFNAMRHSRFRQINIVAARSATSRLFGIHVVWNSRNIVARRHAMTRHRTKLNLNQTTTNTRPRPHDHATSAHCV
jgi:type IV secretory pathway TrbD component